MSKNQTPTTAEIDAELTALRRGIDELDRRLGVPILICRRTKINGKAYSPGTVARVPEAFGAILIDLQTASRSDKATPDEARRLDTALSERRGRYGNASLR